MYILSLVPTAMCNRLAPTPNIRESDEITSILSRDSSPMLESLSVGSELTCLSSYRGYMLYCAGGITVNRIESTTEGVNGRSYMPIIGHEENVLILSNFGHFNARIRF